MVSKEIDPNCDLNKQFDEFCKECLPPTYLGEQIGAWTRWMAWIECDGGKPIGMFAGRVSSLTPLQGEILLTRDLGRV